MNRIIAGLVLVSASIMGCASNSALHAQLDRAEKVSHQQDLQIAELEARQKKLTEETLALSASKVGADLKQDASTMADVVWHWSVDHVTEAVHSTEEAAHRCYLKGKDQGGVHNLQDAQKLAQDCWNAN
jgi:hypothetical protein